MAKTEAEIYEEQKKNEDAVKAADDRKDAENKAVSLFASKDLAGTYILSGVGVLAGISYAFKNEKGFWGYVGFILLGSIAGGTIGGIIDYMRKDKA